MGGGEEVGVGFADSFRGVFQAEEGGVGAIDADESALGVFEVDDVGDAIHQHLEQMALRAGATRRA